MKFAERSFVAPFIVAGPCSAESEEQVFSTAQILKRSGKVDLFRAGLWKPRTRPDSFEGLGVKALPWLRRVQEELDLPVTVEVGHPSHIDPVLNAGIKTVWLGARTTVNPFLVQELADALRGTGVRVMVKNPVNPDVDLWMGAIERVYKAGINDIIAIHRGFSSAHKGVYRNNPYWPVAIDLRLRLPDLPIICDPSHIAGKRELLGEVMQYALDLNYDGFMVEVHPDPAHAMSDAGQQIDPEGFFQLMSQLVYKSANSPNALFESQVQELRLLIDEIDTRLLEAIARRMEIVERIGEHKKENNVTILQLERWFEVLNTRTRKGELLGLKKDFIARLLDLVHEESIRKQQELIDQLKLQEKK